MRIHIAVNGDTLHTIAYQYRIKVDELIPLNPHIEYPDLNIGGKQVKLPARPEEAVSPIYPPACELDPIEEFQDHWIPLTPLEKMAETDYDVLIIGSGAGGGAALWRLCEQWRQSGKRIGMIEAGGLLLQTNVQNIATMNSTRAAKYYLNPNISYPIGQFLPEYSGARQVFALGGRTLFWNVVTPRMHPVDLQQWPVPAKELELYYNIAERAMYVTKAFSMRSAFTEILLNRLWAGGIPEATYSPKANDMQATEYGKVHSNVFFSSISFLARALNLRPFDLAVNARAVELVTDRGRAVGVKVMTPELKTYFLKAKTIVLSASSFETPRLLLHSGIEGRVIGHYLTNHSVVRAGGTVRTKDFPEELGVLGILIPRTESRPYQVQIHDAGGYYWYHEEEKPVKDEWPYSIAAFGLIESRFENAVTLDPLRKDKYGVPEIQVRFSYSERDLVIMREMMSGIQQASSIMRAPLATKDGRPDICLWKPGRDAHEAGTCRMGDDPAVSAADRYGQIHGVSGLFVADNSVLPSIGGANPTLTTVALAIRTADYIARHGR